MTERSSNWQGGPAARLYTRLGLRYIYLLLATSRKLVVFVVTLNVLSCFLAAGVSTGALGPSGKIALGVGMAAAVALTLLLGMSLLLRRSLVCAVRGRDAELVEELRRSRARIVAAGAAERRRVERDLHDGAQQELVLLGMKLAMAKRLIETDPEAALMTHDELCDDLDRALTQLRDLAHGIYPAVLENAGLAAALRELTGSSGVAASVVCDADRRFASELEAAVYFCCLEALQNAAKHAGTNAQATIRIQDRDGALRFSVIDDGPGFDPASNDGGGGLQNMRDRIGALGGALSVISAPGAGTIVAGMLPLEAAVTTGV